MQNAWGKRDRESGDELGLVAHSADVAAVATALTELAGWRRRLEALAHQTLSEQDIARLGALAFLHDVGKTNVGFQAKRIEDHAARTHWLAPAGLKLHECGHTAIATLLLDPQSDHADAFAQALPIAEIEEWQGIDLWLAAISHHGDPIQEGAMESSTLAERAFVRPHEGYDPLAALRALGLSTRTWFPLAFAPGPPLPNAAEFVHAFAGLVSLADWVASDARPGFFPYTPDDQHSDRFIWALGRARAVLARMGIDVTAARADLIARSPTFNDVFEVPPYAAQSAMSDTGLGPIVILESETGSGKTEAAFWRFKTLFETGEVDSLAFVLPTRISAVQLEERARRFMAALFPDPTTRPATVLAVPGYLRVDGDDGERLAPFETQWPDDPDQQRAHRTWAAENAKRFLAAPIAIGTVDQALLAGIMARHAHLRGAALLRSLLVVDEVHASDAFMTTTLRGLLRRHAAAGGHALLLSATLGAGARTKLLDVQPVPSMQAAQQTAYPAVSDRNAVRRLTHSGREKTIQFTCQPWMGDAESIAARALEAALDGARVLIVRNTVAGALAVQSALEHLGDPALLFSAASTVAPHHGRFAAEDRRVLDVAVEARFGKAGPTKGGVVLVGTQTLEISLDLDADFLLSDLCPVDVLLQRAGRLHRHSARNAHRTTAFAKPHAVVLTPAARDLSAFLNSHPRREGHGLGSVYENILAIEATWRSLIAQTQWRIPADNRTLVESATHPDALAKLASALGSDWLKHARDLAGGLYAKMGLAQSQMLDWTEAWSTIQWPSLGEYARTRLGLADRLITFTEPVTSPFGQTLRTLKVPAWMLENNSVNTEHESVQVRRESAMLTFALGGRKFVYDRWGLRLDTRTF